MRTSHTDTQPTSGRRVAYSAPPALPPLWSIELLDVLGRRGRLTLTLAGVGSLVAVVLTFLAPGILAPDPLIGALVGATALAVGLALTLALDALDVRIRGPRHVRSSGGELVALLSELADPDDAQGLAASVMSVRTPGTALFLGLAPVGEDVTSSLGWTHALAEALARDGASVLLVDLAGPTTDRPGIVEVVRDRLPLERAVSYADGLPLALLAPGPDRIAALKALVTLPTVLPDDVDILLVALPQVVNRSAVNASRILDQVLFVAEANLSSRVELMASLDALRVAGCSPQVVLVDGATWHMLRPGRPLLLPPRRSTAILPVVPLSDGSLFAAQEGVTIVGAPVVGAPVTGAAAGPVLRGTAVTVAPRAAVAPIAPREPVEQVRWATPDEPAPSSESEGAALPAEPYAWEPAPSSPPAPAPPASVPEPPRSAGEPSSPLRTVDVLEAAAAAMAESALDATLVDTVPMDRAEVLWTDQHAATSVTPVAPVAPVAPVRPVAPVAPAPAAAPAARIPAAVPVPAQVPAPTTRSVPAAPEELTTELSRESGPLPTWASVEDEEDLLRTTVQLSAFTDELGLRDDA